jgi:signal transduction histidine kinase
VQRSQRHLLGLINQVLNYARIEAGAVTYDLQPVLVGDVIAAVEAVVAPQLRDKELMHAIDVESTSLCVHADPERLQQILLNLLSNAIKFTESGGEVRISASPLDESARQVRIAVTDTGRGIPAEKLEAIFEPFVQVDSRLTRTEGGTGLGLAISRDLARRMAGDLTVVSELGQGSTFTITLNADRIATRQLVS